MTDPTEMLRLLLDRRVPSVLQTESTECGLACLAMVAGYYGLEMDLAQLRRRFPISIQGTTLTGLIEISAELGFSARPLRVDLEELSELPLPAILHWQMNHYVVLTRCSRNRYTIQDPAVGCNYISKQEMSAAFTGVALEVHPSMRFQPQRISQKLQLSQLWKRIRGLGRSVTQVAILSLVLELWVIASPIFLQVVVDDVMPRQDLDLLVVLAVGFGIFGIINAVSSALRQMLILSVGSILSFQLASNVAGHLLKLPFNYFERRNAGDIISRFGGIQQIQSALTSGIPFAHVASVTIERQEGWHIPVTVTNVFVVVENIDARNQSAAVANSTFNAYPRMTPEDIICVALKTHPPGYHIDNHSEITCRKVYEWRSQHR